jgi:hypothetical protein
MRSKVLVALCVAVVAAASCSKVQNAQNGGASATANASGDPTMHGDHNPRHGGLVFMERDIHFEVVATTPGEYAIYYTDMMRNELPASIAADAKITILPSKGDPEIVPLHIDPTGKFWTGAGKIVTDKEATVRTSYVYKSKPYWIDVSYSLVSNPPKSVPTAD